MLWEFRQKSVYPVLNPFFGGISTEEGLAKWYYDLLKGYIVSVSVAFFSGISTEEGNKKSIYRKLHSNHTV